MKFMKNVSDGQVTIDDGQVSTTNNNLWASEFEANSTKEKLLDKNETSEDWVDSFNNGRFAESKFFRLLLRRDFNFFRYFSGEQRKLQYNILESITRRMETDIRTRRV